VTTKLKKLLLIFLLVELTLSYSTAFAQTLSGFDYQKAGVSDQIAKYLCAPNTVPEKETEIFNNVGQAGKDYQTTAAFNNNNSGVLYQCINQIYKFAIVIAAVVGVFFIVIAGYIYMSSDGDAEAVSKAKSILTSSIASIVILYIGYVLLKALNPDLIEFQSVQPPSVTITNYNQSDGVTVNAGVCKVDQGGCSIQQISQCGAWGTNPQIASAVCFKESGGNPAISSGTDLCLDGKSWSIGLFQINIIAHGGASYMPPECKAGIIKVNGTGTTQGGCAVPLVTNDKGVTYCPKSNCQVVDMPAYNSCVEALKKASTNITAACSIYQKQGWGAWANSYKLCSVSGGGTNLNTQSNLNSTCKGSSNSGTMLLGDSFMDGMKNAFSLKENLNVNSYCKPGDTISANISAVNKQISRIQSATPNLTFISLGTNNYFDSASTIKTQQNQLINSLKQSGVKKIIWIGPPKFTQPQLNYKISVDQNLTIANTLKTGAAENGICYYDTYNNLNLYGSGVKDIHDLNYSVWANSVWDWANKNCN
jgi:hypothetical protein